MCCCFISGGQLAGCYIRRCLLLPSHVWPASYRACAADGQTGTGKTHTMTGDIDDDLTDGAGVIPRAIHQIFSHLEGEAPLPGTEYCSYLAGGSQLPP